MFPARSVTNILPSGANATSHGNESPDCTVVVVSVGALPLPTGTPGTVIVRNTPSSSIHQAPSTTGRRCSEYEPGELGARIWNVKVAVAPGGTVCSACAATRVENGQFNASGAHCPSSMLMPRRASSPRIPLFHVLLPAGDSALPGLIAGVAEAHRVARRRARREDRPRALIEPGRVEAGRGRGGARRDDGADEREDGGARKGLHRSVHRASRRVVTRRSQLLLIHDPHRLLLEPQRFVDREHRPVARIVPGLDVVCALPLRVADRLEL